MGLKGSNRVLSVPMGPKGSNGILSGLRGPERVKKVRNVPQDSSHKGSFLMDSRVFKS